MHVVNDSHAPIRERPREWVWRWKVFEDYGKGLYGKGGVVSQGKWQEAKYISLHGELPLREFHYPGFSGFHVFTSRKLARGHTKRGLWRRRIVKVQVAHLLDEGKGDGLSGGNAVPVETYQWMLVPHEKKGK